MPMENTVFEEFGARPVINGVGTRTQVGGARWRTGVAEAMRRAGTANVSVPELQAKASERIAEATGAEAGFVTPGAAAGMVMSAAACIAGDDYAVMEQLPQTAETPSEIVIPKAHRIKYDVALRASGATLVDVGHVSHHPVNGGVDHVESWQLASAIDEATVAVAYVQRPHNVLSLESVVDVAHSEGVPVIVDAASEVPPPQNLERFIEIGADLVVYSGGKGLRGPQASGFVAGRRDLIRSIALQHLPDGYHPEIWDPPSGLIDREQVPDGTPPTGLGRPFKVGPEEIVGVLTALEGFLEEDHDATVEEWRQRADRIVNELDGLPGVGIRLSAGRDKASGVPKVILDVSDATLGPIELIRTLRDESPRIWLGERRVHVGEVTIAPQGMTDREAEHVIERIKTHLGDGS